MTFRAYEILVDGVTDDLSSYRDTYLLLAPVDVDVTERLAAALRTHAGDDASWQALLELDVAAFEDVGLIPACSDPDLWLEHVVVCPNLNDAFGRCETVFLPFDQTPGESY